MEDTDKKDSEKKVLRDARGRLMPGTKSPNSGGYRWRRTQLSYQLFATESEDIIRSVIDRAKEGDATAMRLCVERIVPPRKNAPIKFDLPPVTSSDEAKNAIATVLAAQCAGEITQDEAEGLLRTITTFIQVCSVAELERRVNEIDQKVGK